MAVGDYRYSSSDIRRTVGWFQTFSLIEEMKTKERKETEISKIKSWETDKQKLDKCSVKCKIQLLLYRSDQF